MPSPRPGAAGGAANTETALLDPAQESALNQVKALVETREADILSVLPASVTLDRLKGVYLHALERNPELLTCSPASLVRALMHSAETGLEPTGVLGLAYLVPRWNSKTNRNEAHFEIGYRGLINLAKEAKDTKAVDAHAVYWGDRYRVIQGTEVKVIHEPTSKDRTWDNLRGAYAIAKLVDGSILVEEMDKAQLEAHRDRYAPRNRAGEVVGPWTTEPGEMSRKTVIRRLSKRLKLTRSAERAIQLEDEGFADAGGFDQAAGPPAVQLTGGSRRDRIMAAVDRADKPEPKNVTPQAAEASQAAPEPEPESQATQTTPGGRQVTGDGEVVGEELPGGTIGEPPPVQPAPPPPVTRGTSYSGTVEFTDRAATNGGLRRLRGTPTIGFRLNTGRKTYSVEATNGLAEELDTVFETLRLGGGSPVTVMGTKEFRSFEKEGEGTINYEVIVAHLVTDGAGTWGG